MIIICDNCNTSFKVPDKAIGPEGRFVRCSKCSYEWVAKLPEENNSDAEKEQPNPKFEESTQEKTAGTPQQESTSGDNVKETTNNEFPKPKRTSNNAPPPALPFYQKNLFYYTIISATTASVLVFLFFMITIYKESIMRTFPASEAVYNQFGIYDYSNFTFENVSCKLVNPNNSSGTNSTNSQQKNLLIELDLTIKNNNNFAQPVNYIKIVTFDKNMNKIGDLIIKHHQIIKPHESKSITGSIHSVSSKAEYVSFTIGNYLDLYLYDLSSLKYFVPLKHNKPNTKPRK